MYDVLYAVPPSMLTVIDCGRVASGVFPEKAIDIPTIQFYTTEKDRRATYLQRTSRTSRTFEHWQTRGTSRFHHTKKRTNLRSNSEDRHK